MSGWSVERSCGCSSHTLDRSSALGREELHDIWRWPLWACHTHTHTHTRAPHRGPCPPTSSWDSDGDIYGAHADWSLLNIHVSSVCQQIAVCIADKMGMLVHVCASIHLHTYVSPGSRVGTGRLHIGRWLNIYCAVMDTLQTFWNWIAVSWQSFLNI